MRLCRGFLMDCISIYFNYHYDSILDYYKIRLNPAIFFPTTDKYWKRRERDSYRF